MSESPPKRSAFAGLLGAGLVALAVGAAIRHASSLQPQQNATVEFTLHLPTLDCQLQAYTLLGNKTSGFFDSGDALQQKLWALAQRCGGRITSVATPKHNLIPTGPARNG